MMSMIVTILDVRGLIVYKELTEIDKEIYLTRNDFFSFNI